MADSIYYVGCTGPGTFLSDQRQLLIALLESSGPALHGLLVRLTLRQEVAEELLQDLFLRLRQSPQWAKADNPAAYAARMAINLAMDWRRKQARRRPVSELAVEPAGDWPSPLAAAENAEQIERLMQAVSRLGGTCRDAVILHYLQQQPYDEVAMQLGKSEHQVRALCAKGIRHLRKDLAGTPAQRPDGTRP